MKNKKKNNPFRMVLPYIGALIPYLIVIYSNFMCFGLSCQNNNPIWKYVYIDTIIGFLIGWGLTLLYRKFKKRR